MYTDIRIERYFNKERESEKQSYIKRWGDKDKTTEIKISKKADEASEPGASHRMPKAAQICRTISAICTEHCKLHCNRFEDACVPVILLPEVHFVYGIFSTISSTIDSIEALILTVAPSDNWTYGT